MDQANFLFSVEKSFGRRKVNLRALPLVAGAVGGGEDVSVADEGAAAPELGSPRTV